MENSYPTIQTAYNSNESCPSGSARNIYGDGDGQTCCFGALLVKLDNDIVAPLSAFSGLILSTTSIIVLSQVIVVGEDRKQVSRRYWKPAHYLLKSISIYCFIFFLTSFPLILSNCTSIDELCSSTTTTGAYGYALATLTWSLSILCNNIAHWCNYTLIIIYGLERALTIRKSKLRFTMKTALYCHFVAVQLSFLKGWLDILPYKVIKVEDNWIIGLGKNAKLLALGSGFLITGSLSIFQLIADCFLFAYVTLWLLLNDKRKRIVRNSTCSSITLRNSLNKAERKLTLIYVLNSSFFLLHLLSGIVNNVIRMYFLPFDDPVANCNAKYITVEIANFLQKISELVASSMGIVVSRQIRAKRLVKSLMVRRPSQVSMK